MLAYYTELIRILKGSRELELWKDNNQLESYTLWVGDGISSIAEEFTFENLKELEEFACKLMDIVDQERGNESK